MSWRGRSFRVEAPREPCHHHPLRGPQWPVELAGGLKMMAVPLHLSCLCPVECRPFSSPRGSQQLSGECVLCCQPGLYDRHWEVCACRFRIKKARLSPGVSVTAQEFRRCRGAGQVYPVGCPPLDQDSQSSSSQHGAIPPLFLQS